MTTSPFDLALRIFHLPACCEEQSLVHLGRRELKAVRVPEESSQAGREENARPTFWRFSACVWLCMIFCFLEDLWSSDPSMGWGLGSVNLASCIASLPLA